MTDRALRITRLEIWTDVAFNGGVRLAFIPDFLKGVMESWELNGRERLVVPLSRTSQAWADIEHGRVMRAFYSDRTWTEWRIVKFDDAHERSNALTAVVECESILYDLGTSGIITRVEANGAVNHDFDLYGLLPSEHVDVILGGSGNYVRAAPTYFEAGTIAPTTKVDFSYRGDSPLSALRELVELSSKAEGVPYELECTSNGTDAYLVHIRQVGADAGKVWFRYAKNLTAVRQESDGTELATRIYPRGPEIEGYHHTMAEAQWRITGKSGNNVTLESGAIAFDDQLNGLYLERVASGARTQIVDTIAATNQLQLTSAAAFNIGDLVSVRKDNDGTRLTYLEHPARQALYRVRSAPLDRPDLPPADNLVPNPFLDAWGGGLPTGWSAIGGATIAQNTDALYRRYGSASAKVTAAALDAGIETAWIPIVPTETNRYGTAQFALLVTKGTYRVELVVSDGVTETVLPDPSQQKAAAPASIDWTDRFAIAGIDLYELGATQFRLRMRADALDSVSNTAEAYLDAVMMTQTAGGSESFAGSRTSNELWKAANEALLSRSLPKLSYEIDVVDLYAIDREAFQFDRLVLGGTVQTVDADLGLNFETRIVQLDIDRTMPGVAKVRLSNRPEDLVGLLGKQQRRRRLGGALIEPFSSGVHCDPILDEDSGSLNLVPNRGPGAGAVKYLVSTGSAPTRNDVIASGVVTTAASVPVHTFTSGTQHVWVGVVATQYANGSGTQGELELLPYTFRPGADAPTIHVLPIVPSSDDKEAIRLTLVDDGDHVAMYYRTYTKGTTPPAFTRVPGGSSFAADPLVQDIEVTKPAEGAQPIVIEAYGVDDSGNRTARNTYLEVDGDGVPSGLLHVITDDRNGNTWVIPVSPDISDTGSWRFRVTVVSIGSDTYNLPAFSDAAADEYSGSTWGELIPLTQALDNGKQINVAGYFFRTTQTTATAQNASRRSNAVFGVQLLGRRSPTASGAEIDLQLQAASGQLTIGRASIGPEANWWRAWARLGAAPTTDGTATQESIPDSQYLVIDDPTTVASRKIAASDGTWHVMAQAYDLVAPGPFEFDSIVVSSGGGGGGATLSNLNITLQPTAHRVRWNHDSAAATGHRVVIRQTRFEPAGTFEDELVPFAAARSPTLDGASDTVPDEGYYDAPVNFGDKGDPGVEFVLVRYTIELWTNAGVRVRTYTVERYDYLLVFA